MTIVRFLHITDTHIGPNKEYALQSQLSYAKARKVVDYLNLLSFPIDFIIHTGDVVADPDPASYQLAKDLFSTLKWPCYYLCGNHDARADVWRYFPMSGIQKFSERSDEVCYAFDLKEVRFIVLDADSVPTYSGKLPQAQLAFLKEQLDTCAEVACVFLHYPPFPLDNPWSKESMLLTNGKDLHDILVSAPCRIGGVFHGHIHRNLNIIRDGILYSSPTATVCEFRSFPDDEIPAVDTNHVPTVQLVTVTKQETILKGITVV